MSVIELEHLTHIYNEGSNLETKALDDVSVKIEEGQYIGIIGHTGSGKSTLVKHINCILKPTSGRVYLNGVDVWKGGLSLVEIRRKVGLVFQYPEYQLFEDTVGKDIAFGPRNLGLDESEINRRVQQLAYLMGISESVLNKSPFEISGGQQRRVAIAGVLAMNPQILILDEPTAGLDPMGKEKILGILENYHKAKNCTILHITHSMDDISRYADNILVMNGGKIFKYGLVRDIFKHASELEQIGLDIPQITKVFLKLRRLGFDVPADVYTIEHAAKIIKEIMLKKAEL